MARKASTKDSSSTATIGFEATALRESAFLQSKAKLRSPQGNRWLAADTALRASAFLRTGGNMQVMTERHDKLRNNMDAAETSGASKSERSGDRPTDLHPKRLGQTAAGSPKGERGGAHQYSRSERDRLPQAARRVGAWAPINHVVLGLIFLSRAERDRSRDSVTRRASRGLRVKYISDTAGKCRMANAEVRNRSDRPIRHSKFNIRNFPWSHLQANAKQPTVGMSNAEVRMTNRSRFTSTFENRQSKFA